MAHELTFNELVVESQYLLTLQSGKITKMLCLGPTSKRNGGKRRNRQGTGERKLKREGHERREKDREERRKDMEGRVREGDCLVFI